MFFSCLYNILIKSQDSRLANILDISLNVYALEIFTVSWSVSLVTV